MKTNQLYLLAGLLLALLTTLLPNAALAQVKIGNNYTTIGTASNLEVEATNGKKTIVNKATGQVTIQDGTEGAGKILTSDATGASSWQTLTSANIPELVFAATQPNTAASPYVVPVGASNGVGASRIPFTPILGTGYNSTTREYLIPSTGFYRVTSGIRCTSNSGTQYIAQLVLKAGIGPSDQITISATVSLARTFTVSAPFNAGDSVFFYVDNGFPGAAATNCATGFLTVEKLQ